MLIVGTMMIVLLMGAFIGFMLHTESSLYKQGRDEDRIYYSRPIKLIRIKGHLSFEHYRIQERDGLYVLWDYFDATDGLGGPYIRGRYKRKDLEIKDE